MDQERRKRSEGGLALPTGRQAAALASHARGRSFETSRAMAGQAIRTASPTARARCARSALTDLVRRGASIPLGARFKRDVQGIRRGHLAARLQIAEAFDRLAHAVHQRRTGAVQTGRGVGRGIDLRRERQRSAARPDRGAGCGCRDVSTIWLTLTVAPGRSKTPAPSKPLAREAAMNAAATSGAYCIVTRPVNGISYPKPRAAAASPRLAPRSPPDPGQRHRRCEVGARCWTVRVPSESSRPPPRKRACRPHRPWPGESPPREWRRRSTRRRRTEAPGRCERRARRGG